MNAYIERFIGSFNREALFKYHKIHYNEKSLRKLCREYIYFYNNFRTHQGIAGLTIPVFKSNKKNKHVNELDLNFKKLKTKSYLDNNITYFYYQDNKKTA